VQIKKSILISLLTLAALLLLINALLVLQNRNLVATLKERAASMEPSPGVVVPALDGLDIDGKRTMVDYGADPRKTVLFVFSSTCGICKENWPAWQSIKQRVNTNDFRLVFVDLSSLVGPRDINEYGLSNFRVFSRLEPKVQLAYNLRLTP
jgi:hypothetical protein